MCFNLKKVLHWILRDFGLYYDKTTLWINNNYSLFYTNSQSQHWIKNPERLHFVDWKWDPFLSLPVWIKILNCVSGPREIRFDVDCCKGKPTCWPVALAQYRCFKRSEFSAQQKSELSRGGGGSKIKEEALPFLYIFFNASVLWNNPQYWQSFKHFESNFYYHLPNSLWFTLKKKTSSEWNMIFFVQT